ncbi:hypothetical protein QYE76_070440 [Lolium multiflorum]|uniref:Uncharacterized protein n=1 Tax=Lolium multiflorum TaxID=4521 RepID=A0AAD8SKL3_LOLMU|nr:hypothetical protein QYE76_070440 [Lolium multiflorum]
MSAVIDRLARHTGGVERENLRVDGGGPRVRRDANGGAAVGGHHDAFYSPAVIQFSGSGGSKDDRALHAGAALYMPAASIGHVGALGELGYCLQDSYGVRYSLLDGRRLLIQDNNSEVTAASASLFKAFRGATGACPATSALLGQVDALDELVYCLQDSYGVLCSLFDGRRLLIQDNANELAATSASLFKPFRSSAAPRVAVRRLRVPQPTARLDAATGLADYGESRCRALSDLVERLGSVRRRLWQFGKNLI